MIVWKGTAPMDRGDIPRAGFASMKSLSQFKKAKIYTDFKKRSIYGKAAPAAGASVW